MTVDQDPSAIPLPQGSAAQMPPEALSRYRAFMRREAPKVQDDWMQVDIYKATIEALDPSMVNRLHELTVSVFWPHRAPDIELVVGLGTGYVALDEIGRPLSSVMGFCSDPDFAMLGMMVTMPRLQAQGTGGRLLRRVMTDCQGRDLRLSATRQGYRLYESAGFTPVGLVYQHQGIARAIRPPASVPGLSLRPLEPRDMEAVLGLDLHAFGAARRAILDVLLGASEAIVAERGGQIEGFAMMRNFGKGKVIGPLIAEQDDVAMQLAAHFIMAQEGSFLRLDTIVESERFEAFLSAAGMGVYDTVTDMRFGRLRRATTGPVTYGLAMQSLG
ncbi:GNAT family N-acetyltransferase [Pseudooceanicola sp. CBS1P-1]|uniref:GNAT family N-acetyltransferase n=1 Tax=Pseudooceanicola albus TaxID=2692189 RepID=A0A6L7G3A4_9RHOB|nr:MULTISPECIES: GNAT family N-acetyltransferase [Pseudooceanicola]MBT9385103.1 GNAT family N-acetyltransferase [Pseudooceanicola endophyticus]MXN18605.1 GNAT family N-acetyltransferase [Pseudooceanicola albus]